MNNKICLIGGQNATTCFNDTFSDNNITNWDNIVTNAPFSGRSYFLLYAFKNKLFVASGIDATNWFSDIWMTDDLKNWYLVNESIETGARTGSACCLYNDKMWIMGGTTTGGVRKNDVWSSTNGINWTQETASAAWGTRGGHQVIVYDNKMWITGGSRPGVSLKDVWYSTSGTSWTLANNNAWTTNKYEHQLVVFDNKMLVISGAYTTDVWSSSNGTTWTQIATSVEFGARSYHQCLVINGKIYLFGRYEKIGSNYYYRNDIWESSNGIVWTKIKDTSVWSARLGHKVCFFEINQKNKQNINTIENEIIINDIKIKNNEGVIEIKNTSDELVNLKISNPSNILDMVTKFYIDSKARPIIIKRQADCSSTIPDNTDTAGFLVVTTAGNGTSIGNILYDNGESENSMAILDKESGCTIACTIAFTGGTIALDADTIYMWTTEWEKIGDISNYTDALRNVRMELNTDTTQESTFEIPANSNIWKVILKISTAYSAGSTIEIGYNGDADAIVTSSEIDITKQKDYILKKSISWSSANKLRATISGSPTVGAGTISVLFF